MATNLSNANVNRLPFAARFPVDVWLTGFAFLIPATYLFLHNQTRILVAFMFFSALILIWMRDRTMGIVATFIFLLTLGDVRRILDMVAPASAGLDLLLLVGPLFAVYLAIPLLLRLKVADTLSKALLALMAIMILEMFNPRQGSIVVGFSGALFYIIPIFWFWIARNYATDHMMFLLFYRVFLPIGILDGLLGVAQAYIGFFPWEKSWVLKLGNQYVYTAGHFRSFGFSTGAGEFASTLLIASVCVIAAIFAGQRAYALLLPVLIAASILASSRGLIVKLLFAAAMIWAVRSKGSRSWLPRLLFALVVGFGVTYYSASHAAGDDEPSSRKASTAQIATDHVTKGLSDPAHSTASLHWQIFLGGIVKGFTYPIGTGIGAVTLGAGKFTAGGATTGSSEVDISDAFITMGFVGGGLYIFIIYKVFRLAFGYVRRGPLIMSLAYFGLFAALLGGWLALGQYSTAPFVWFCIGSLVRKSSSVDSRSHSIA
jgi:hypothetical protein